MIQTSIVHLPHGIDLSIRTSGDRGQPVLMFLHGFPEAAFVWDEYLEHFSKLGYRAVAPNLRGFERSSCPADVSAYRAKHLMQDIAALIELEVNKGGATCLFNSPRLGRRSGLEFGKPIAAVAKKARHH